MTESVKLAIPSNPKYLGLVRKVLHHLLADHEVSGETSRRLILCVDEACSNIIKYSYEGCPDQTIALRFSLAEASFQVKIRDYGKQLDSRDIKPRPLQKIEPGGLGTYFINEIMDEVDYCTNRELGTLLTMRKSLKDELTSSRERIR